MVYGGLASRIMATRSRERGQAVGRREFLATLAALGSAAVGGHGGAALAERLNPLRVQPSTVRTLRERDFEGTLAGLAAIGFREVEFAGYHGRTPKAARAALARAGLVAP